MKEPCRSCGKSAGHYPSCGTLKTKPCVACGGPKPAVAGVRYCARCKETVCPECRSYGGHHQKQCLWVHRARLVLRRHYQGLGPPRTPYQGVVSREDIRELYEAQRTKAIALAHKLGANGDSEDCVHDVILWLIERQDYLKAPPTTGYFFVAVKRAVAERARTSYIQRTVWADAYALVDLEEMQYARDHGRVKAVSPEG